MEPLDLNDYDIEAVNAPPEVEQDVPDQTQLDPDLGVQDLGVDDVVNAGPIRRTRPKLDADKLLNPQRGYPELLRGVRKIKYRGPGDEKKYLRKYVMTYQIWANRLWPKANFDDFIVLARRAGRDPRVRQYCRGLIDDEKYGGVSDRDANDGARASSSGHENGHDLDQGHANERDNEHDNNDEFERGLDRGLDRDLDRGLDRDLDRDLEELDRELGPEYGIDDAAGESNVRGYTDNHAGVDAEPNDDELEAAMDLYADMGF